VSHSCASDRIAAMSLRRSPVVQSHDFNAVDSLVVLVVAQHVCVACLVACSGGSDRGASAHDHQYKRLRPVHAMQSLAPMAGRSLCRCCLGGRCSRGCAMSRCATRPCRLWRGALGFAKSMPLSFRRLCATTMVHLMRPLWLLYGTACCHMADKAPGWHTTCWPT